MQDNRGSKREVESTPPKAIPEPTHAQQTSLRKQKKKAKKLAAAFDAAAAEPAFGPLEPLALGQPQRRQPPPTLTRPQAPADPPKP